MSVLLLASLLSFTDLSAPAEITVDGWPAGAAVAVAADGAVTVRESRPFSWVRLAWPARMPAGTRVFGGSFERTYGDSGWRPVETAAGALPCKGALAWYFLASDGRRTDGYGVAVQPNVFASWRVATNRIELVLDCRAGSRPVRLAGRALEACRLVSRRGADGERAFAAGRAFCRLMCPSPRLPKEPVYGYNDWYCAYGENTATNFLADAAFVCSLVKGERVRPYVVADDGWQKVRNPAAAEPGERWNGSNAHWGMPMDEFARRIRALDAKPGVWYRPFLPDGGTRQVPTDPTDPALADRIRAELRRFAGWGIALVKIDFITWEWAARWGFDFADSPVVRDLPAWRDESRTSAEVVKGLYRAMREGAGDDMVIIGCNALDHFAAGLFEIQRTGDDTSGREWARTRKMGPNTLGMRAIHDRTFYVVDGDCFGLADAGAVPAGLNLQWLDLIARSGTALFVSWKRQLTTPRYAAALETALRRAARARPTGEPLDWQEALAPRRWDFGGETAVYDWGADSSAPANGAVWHDTAGHVVNAHGCCVLADGGRYYLYGEHKVYGPAGCFAHVGVHAYSSSDLRRWTDEGIALPVSRDPASDIADGCILERPKVIRCAKTGKYVMYFHLERKGVPYTDARVGIATADRPAGPFEFVRSTKVAPGAFPVGATDYERSPEALARAQREWRVPCGRSRAGEQALIYPAMVAEGQDSRDMTLFVDDDGRAYLIHSSERNSTLHVTELTDDCLGFTGRWWRAMEKEWTEAPAVCKKDGWYYLIGSDCTGWAPNEARLYRARAVTGPWERVGNPCRGVNPANGLGPERTWGGQSSFILRTADGRHLAMFDMWNPENQVDSRYIWLPIAFGDGTLAIDWRERFE